MEHNCGSAIGAAQEGGGGGGSHPRGCCSARLCSNRRLVCSVPYSEGCPAAEAASRATPRVASTARRPLDHIALVTMLCGTF